MKRDHGIIIILVGVGLLFISIFFSSGSYHKFDFMTNLQIMEVVLDKGTIVSQEEKKPKTLLDAAFPDPPKRVGKVAIPLKYLLSMSVLLVLIGIGIVLLSKNNKKSA